MLPVPDLSDFCGDSGPWSSSISIMGGRVEQGLIETQCKVGLRSAQPTVLLRHSGQKPERTASICGVLTHFSCHRLPCLLSTKRKSRLKSSQPHCIASSSALVQIKARDVQFTLYHSHGVKDGTCLIRSRFLPFLVRSRGGVWCTLLKAGQDSHM